MPTTNTPVRLTESDRAKIEAVRERYGLPSLAAAIRFSVESEYRRLKKSSTKGGPANGR